MPSIEEHKRKYEENRRLLDTNLNIECCDFYNWIVTVSFYAALHLVEARLAEEGVDSKDHFARNNNVERFRYFKNIRNQYKTLYDKSRIARYDGSFMNKKKGEFALKCLKEIEEQLI